MCIHIQKGGEVGVAGVVKGREERGYDYIFIQIDKCGPNLYQPTNECKRNKHSTNVRVVYNVVLKHTLSYCGSLFSTLFIFFFVLCLFLSFLFFLQISYYDIFCCFCVHRTTFLISSCFKSFILRLQ